MISKEIWNGYNYEQTTFDGRVLSAVEDYKKTLSMYRDKYRKEMMPTGDWLVVTIDYHN